MVTYLLLYMHNFKWYVLAAGVDKHATQYI